MIPGAETDKILPSIDRYEMKYVIPIDLIGAISRWISPYTDLDKYSRGAVDNLYDVNSIYFDTPDFLFLRKRLARCDDRFALRIR